VAKRAISPLRSEDYTEWYQQVIKGSDLAEHSAVRGCMVIKPWGYSLWENIQKVLDTKFKETGHQNAYFPLFIPLSYLEKEAEHVEGFAKECAVVTHHRLEKDDKGGLVPAGKLQEPLIVRPTSEMIIGESFSKWIQSHRDLPLLINQWCNVVRWEMRTRLFLRTAEFLWQEGHTAHATKEEAEKETLTMLDVYHDFARNYLAMPVIKGQKTDLEKFPGADTTYCIEAMMQDKKALQMGTSHFLGQNFAKSCDILFQDEDGERKHAWTTSWGTTTRMIGGMIMTHSDDDGLVIPPRVAPSHVVILPILHKEETAQQVLDYCSSLKKQLEANGVRVVLDKRDIRGGEKKWSWIKKGVPIRVEVGFREVEADKICYFRRDLEPTEKQLVEKNHFIENANKILETMQENLLKKAEAFRDANTKKITSYDDFVEFFNPKKGGKQNHGGFAECFFIRDDAMEEKIQEELNVSVRCIPLEDKPEEGICFISNKPTTRKVLFAKAY
jgi:prolyl-tRNA synthetase